MLAQFGLARTCLNGSALWHVDPLSFRHLDWRSSLAVRLAYERSLETRQAASLRKINHKLSDSNLVLAQEGSSPCISLSRHQSAFPFLKLADWPTWSAPCRKHWPAWDIR